MSPTAIITGASRGLGFALAEALAERGWRLVIDARDEDELAAARAELATRTEVVAVAGDVADAWHRGRLLWLAGERIDLLVNNASTLGATPLPALADYPLAALQRTFEVNVLAPLALVQLALPRMAAGARIINVTSDAAVEGYEGWGGYGASKAALEQLSNVLAAERPRPADLCGRSRRHEHAHAPGGLSRRGHLRPAVAARQRARPARARRGRRGERAPSRRRAGRRGPCLAPGRRRVLPAGARPPTAARRASRRRRAACPAMRCACSSPRPAS